MNECIRKKPKINKKKIAVILLVFFVIGTLMAIALPGYLPYRPETYCHRVESDALHIKAAIADYFSDPTHADLNIKPEDLGDMDNIINPWTLKVYEDNIFIQVVDSNKKCPDEYQKLYQKWHSGVYTLKVLD